MIKCFNIECSMFSNMSPKGLSCVRYLSTLPPPVSPLVSGYTGVLVKGGTYQPLDTQIIPAHPGVMGA